MTLSELSPTMKTLLFLVLLFASTVLSQCPTNSTLCIGCVDVPTCCPHKNAVCCLSGLRCCPAGYACTADEISCIRRNAEGLEIRIPTM
ncbi:hypothetical protein L596_010493 [Steinernema carpocapsae]|uniref:Granulins domain-containing protein n=1 Tax=Steinernema carpocapsae TaxID=34508 RepID=A0A4U5PJ20_STECR|nr:hypothetical protein L596_010493 [Steinernema carpocapsae]